MFIAEINGVPNLLLQGPLARVLLSIFQEVLDGDSAIHRTTVSEFSGDALDQVELEMVNDALYNSALEAFGEKGSVATRAISQALHNPTGLTALPLDNEELLSSLAALLNAVHVHLNKDHMTEGSIGAPQGEDEQENILTTGSSEEEMVAKQIVAVMLCEVLEIWRENF